MDQFSTTRQGFFQSHASDTVLIFNQQPLANLAVLLYYDHRRITARTFNRQGCPMAKLKFHVVARVCYRLCDERGRLISKPLLRGELVLLIAERWPSLQAPLLAAIDVARRRWTSIPQAAQQRDNPWSGEIAEQANKAEPASVQARVCYRLLLPDGALCPELPLTMDDLVRHARKTQPGLNTDQLSDAITVARKTGTSKDNTRKSDLEGPWEEAPLSKTALSLAAAEKPKRPWWARWLSAKTTA